MSKVKSLTCPVDIVIPEASTMQVYLMQYYHFSKWEKDFDLLAFSMICC